VGRRFTLLCRRDFGIANRTERRSAVRQNPTTSRCAWTSPGEQQLLRQTPGWGTTVYNGSQGYGIYLTYRPVV